MNDAELGKTWIDYKASGNPKLKNKLIEHYFTYVKKISIRVAEALCWKVDPSVLASFGVDGLSRAIDRFDMDWGTKFESYSNGRIRGSMLDGLRREDEVPRSVRSASDQFEKCRQNLQNHLGRRVSDVEVIDMIGMSEEDFHKNHRKFLATNPSSIDTHVQNDEIDDIRQDSNENLIDTTSANPDGRLKRKEFFSKLLSKDFSDIERKVIYLYYYKQKTMDRVAQQIGLSESRVSQMHKKILARLKDKIQRNPDYFDDEVFDFISGCSNL